MIDGTGTEETQAREIGLDYFARGCITSRHGHDNLPGQLNEINTNAVFEAARRLSQWVRIVNRWQFEGYAVDTIDGATRSILWFRRMNRFTGCDMFAGIADAVAHTAPARGWTNEWMLGFQLKAYHPSDSSAWKLESYSDYFALNNRCLFGDPGIGADSQWLWHLAYGQRASGINMIAEAPSGWNYGRLTDSSTYINQNATVDFYKSCQIYAPDAEIYAAETVTEGGIELVKITLTARLQNTYGEVDGAPATVSRDMSAWHGATINAEPYRTVENALRLYLMMVDSGYYATAITGDNSVQSTVQGWPDNPFGSIVPHFLLTKLIPEPWEDDNVSQDPSDTPLYHDPWPQMELYLRAMCEGFIDETSTILLNDCGIDPVTGYCTSEGHDLFEFTYENVCMAGFSQRWIGTLPTSTTNELGPDEVRPDIPQGFGPVPNIQCSAELFNQFAAVIDQLDKVRIMLPYKLTCSSKTYIDSTTVSPDICGGTSCGATWLAAWKGTPPPAVTFSSEELPADCTAGGLYVSTSAAIGCGGGTYSIVSYRYVQTYAFELVDSDALYAIPEDWRDMVDGGSGLGGIFCMREVDQIIECDGDSACSEIHPDPTVCSGWTSFSCKFVRRYIEGKGNDDEFGQSFFSASCVFLTSGTLDYGSRPRSGIFYGGDNGGGAVCGEGSQHTAFLMPMENKSLYLKIPVVDQ